MFKSLKGGSEAKRFRTTALWCGLCPHGPKVLLWFWSSYLPSSHQEGENSLPSRMFPASAQITPCSSSTIPWPTAREDVVFRPQAQFKRWREGLSSSEVPGCDGEAEGCEGEVPGVSRPRSWFLVICWQSSTALAFYCISPVSAFFTWHCPCTHACTQISLLKGHQS